jgi:hypothetical protein
MKYRSFLLLLSVVLAGGGCFHRTPKPNPNIATEVEEQFKQRWIAKRMAELQANGVTDPRLARLQAAEEFRKKYEYMKAGQQPDPVAGGRP